MKVLVFDVEATGLFVNDNIPYVTQFSYIIYNLYTKKLEKIVNYYVRIPSEVDLPQKVTELTGITREMCDTKGKDIVDVLFEFYHDYHQVNKIVAHNYSFDSRLIKVEIGRHDEELHRLGCDRISDILTIPYFREKHMHYTCTMKETMNLCCIPFPEKKTTQVNNEKQFAKRDNYKWPTLLELYKHLYKDDETLQFHNSLIDVYVCFRCYMKVFHQTDVHFLEVINAYV